MNVNVVAGLINRTIARVPPNSHGESSSEAGSSSIPTETKNSTANASRIGSASAAARWL